MWARFCAFLMLYKRAYLLAHAAAYVPTSGSKESSPSRLEYYSLLDGSALGWEVGIEDLFEGLGDGALAHSTMFISGRSPTAPSVKGNEHECIKHGGVMKGSVGSQGEGRALLPLSEV